MKAPIASQRENPTLERQGPVLATALLQLRDSEAIPEHDRLTRSNRAELERLGG